MNCYVQINEVTDSHLRRLLEDEDDLWQCIADQGDLKVYKRELEENGIVIDPVKAVCTVKVQNMGECMHVRAYLFQAWSHASTIAVTCHMCHVLHPSSV